MTIYGVNRTYVLCTCVSSHLCLYCTVSWWLNSARCHQVMALFFDVSTKAAERMWACLHLHHQTHPSPPLPNGQSSPLTEQQHMHTHKAEHKHLDHTNEIYFLTADRRTCWTAGANLPPPPPPTTFNPWRAHKQREGLSLGQLEGGKRDG